jgi:hypothetical protein
MKKITLFASMVVATLLVSCSKNTDINNPETDTTGGPHVQLTFGTDAQTRAFFDEAVTPEPWENELLTLSIYVYDSFGNLLIRRSLFASQLSAKSVSFQLPHSVAGTRCSFYAVANADYGDVATASAMEKLIESVTLDEYNDTFDRIVGGRKRTAGFVMTGKVTQKIASVGSSTNVSVSLKRTVAKIAVRTRMDDAFGENYGKGTVTISSMKISNASPVTYSFNISSNFIRRTSFYEFTQTPQKNGSNFDGLFYIYENDWIIGDRVLLTLTGYFDADGDDSTTADRFDVEYRVELSPQTGEILRNSYHRIDVVIKGLAGSVGVNISVADWETPVTQTEGVGN